MNAQHVVVTSANCATAKQLLPLLKLKGYRVTALVRAPATLQADTIITHWMQSAEAATALQQADYIIHLSGEINSKKEAVYVESNLTTTRIVTSNARIGKAQKLVFLSYPGAAAQQANLYLRYKGLAEEELLHCGKTAVIFRCPVIIDSPDYPSRIDTLFVSQQGKPVPVIGNGQQLMHPVYRGDVALAILAALEKECSGVWDLSGAEAMTVKRFIQLVNNNPSVKMAFTPGWLAKLLGRFVKGLSPTFVNILLQHTNSCYDYAIYQQLGLTPTSLTRLWQDAERFK